MKMINGETEVDNSDLMRLGISKIERSIQKTVEEKNSTLDIIEKYRNKINNN